MPTYTVNPFTGKLDTVGLEGLIDINKELPDNIIEHFVGTNGNFVSSVASGGSLVLGNQVGASDANNVASVKSRKGLAVVTIRTAASSRASYYINSSATPRITMNNPGGGSGAGNSFKIRTEMALTTSPNPVSDPCYMGVGLLDTPTAYPIGATARAITIRPPYTTETSTYKISIVQAGVETVLDTTFTYVTTVSTLRRYFVSLFEWDADTGFLTISLSNGITTTTNSLDINTLYNDAMDKNYRFGVFLFRNGTTATPVGRSIAIDNFRYTFDKNYAF